MTTDPPTEPAQGLSIDRSDSERFNMALDWIVDYRGDVTLRTPGGDIECYVFDRSDSGGEEVLRYMTKAQPSRTPLAVEDILEINFSGKDTAAGRSFERWIERYVEKKLAGETASIECDSLHDD